VLGSKGKIKSMSKIESKKTETHHRADRMSLARPLPKEDSDPTTQLCLQCGLCCNGALFADVELQSLDKASRLANLGLPLQKKGRKLAFPQPCRCFDGKLCRIYPDRPAHCRAFECGILNRARALELPLDTAVQTIRDTKRQLRRVDGLLRQLGDRNTDLPLMRRIAQFMAQPIDLAADSNRTELRVELVTEMEQLMKRVHREFLA
jgi:Fe-S-cluster containining protein